MIYETWLLLNYALLLDDIGKDNMVYTIKYEYFNKNYTFGWNPLTNLTFMCIHPRKPSCFEVKVPHTTIIHLTERELIKK